MIKNVAFIVLDSISYKTYDEHPHLFKYCKGLQMQNKVVYDIPNTVFAINDYRLDEIANYYNALGFFTTYAVDWRYGCWIDKSMVDYKMKNVFKHYINVWKNDGASNFENLIETAISQKIDPCFLYIHSFNTHNPYIINKSIDFLYPELYYKKLDELNKKQLKQVNILLDQYYKNCCISDVLIKNYFDNDNWIVIICGDHAELMYEENNYGHDLNRATNNEKEILTKTFLASNRYVNFENNDIIIDRKKIYKFVKNAARYTGLRIF